MDFSSFNITHSGQKWAIINRAIKLFNDEHNSHSLGVDFRASRGVLNTLLPEEHLDKSPAQYLDKRVIWLKTFWNKVLPEIDEVDREAATNALNDAYNKYTLFAKYQREEYKPTKDRLIRDRFAAEKECEGDIRHNPTYEDFKKNGLPSKNPHANPSTNIAYLKRLKKLNNLSEVETEEVDKAKRDMRQISHDDNYWDSRGLNLDDLRLSVGSPMPPDPLEDYTVDYIKVDPDGEVTVATNTITVVNLGKNTDTYVYKDFGAAHFTDFSHLHQCKITAWDSLGTAVPYLLADTIDEYVGARAGNLIGILAVENFGVTGAFSLDQSTGGTWNRDISVDLTLNTDYYFETARAGSAVTSDIYTDVDRTVVFDNLARTNGVALQYYYPLSSVNVAAANRISLISSNTDLQEMAVFQAAWARNSNQIIGAGIL